MSSEDRGPSERGLPLRQAASQRGFYRVLASGSRGARLVELPGVQATVVPVRPWFSIFNSVLYRDPRALEAALPELASEYENADVKAWTVWVPPGNVEATGILNHVRDSTPMLMATAISAVDLERRAELDLVPEPNWQDVARCNDRAHGVPEPWSMGAVFETANDPASHLYAARIDGEIVCALIAREHEGDCYFWFVATVPQAQRRGLASELIRHALRDAKQRGCVTTTLESTTAGEPAYSHLGYQPFGRYEMWERRKS